MLELFPFTVEHMKMARDSSSELKLAVEAEVPDEWPQHDFKEALPFFIDLFSKSPSEPTGQFLIVDRNVNSVVGDIGFHGKPNEAGLVEIGYAVLPEFRNRGIAKAAIGLLIGIAREEFATKGLEAETAADNLFSQRALLANGFLKTEKLRWRLLF